MVKNAYVHIPFCKQKCKYCSFTSFCNLNDIDLYTTKLKEEINHYYKNEQLETLYFGGGTPSLLSIGQLKLLIDLFNTTPQTEITIEINPESANVDYLKNLKSIGINRLSFGCQTFDNEILKHIGRIHNSNDVINSVKTAQSIGFDNINLDFIYGLPNQSIESFGNDLEKAISLKIQHISLYGLKIEEGCAFYNNLPENLADDDLQADMYTLACEIMKKNGFEQYEISNFSLPEKFSHHNLNYWDNNSYYGFGVSSHGYVNKIRYSNNCNMQKYITDPKKHSQEHKVTTREALEEEFFLGLRKNDGIDTSLISEKFKINIEEKYAKIFEKHTQNKLLIKTQNGYALTHSGKLLSNLVLSDFIG
ncbi:MAG: radical SAM family heme chaperone HemW [Candidatus Gastranaerophilales bacterium]